MSLERSRQPGQIQIVTSRLNESIELASFYRSKSQKGRTDVTNAHRILQFAVIGYSQRDLVGAHSHNPLLRQTTGTSECWIVMKGEIKVSLFDTDNTQVFTTKLRRGDAAIFHSGGHSLEVVSRKAQIYELKNGPYEGSYLDRTPL